MAQSQTEVSNARLTIDLPLEMHRMIKTHATLSDLSIKDFVIGAIKMRCDEEKSVKKEVIVKKEEYSKNKMNAKTIAVIRDSIKNHDKLKTFDNADEMMAYLLAPDKKPKKSKKLTNSKKQTQPQINRVSPKIKNLKKL